MTTRSVLSVAALIATLANSSAISETRSLLIDLTANPQGEEVPQDPGFRLFYLTDPWSLTTIDNVSVNLELMGEASLRDFSAALFYVNADLSETEALLFDRGTFTDGTLHINATFSDSGLESINGGTPMTSADFLSVFNTVDLSLQGWGLYLSYSFDDPDTIPSNTSFLLDWTIKIDGPDTNAVPDALGLSGTMTLAGLAFAHAFLRRKKASS